MTTSYASVLRSQAQSADLFLCATFSDGMGWMGISMKASFVRGKVYLMIINGSERKTRATQWTEHGRRVGDGLGRKHGSVCPFHSQMCLFHVIQQGS